MSQSIGAYLPCPAVLGVIYVVPDSRCLLSVTVVPRSQDGQRGREGEFAIFLRACLLRYLVGAVIAGTSCRATLLSHFSSSWAW